MVARAISKYVRISGRKVNKYSSIIRNLSYKEARAALMHTPSHGAKVLGNVIQSAVSNLMVKSKNIDEDTIVVDKVTAVAKLAAVFFQKFPDTCQV